MHTSVSEAVTDRLSVCRLLGSLGRAGVQSVATVACVAAVALCAGEVGLNLKCMSKREVGGAGTWVAYKRV